MEPEDLVICHNSEGQEHVLGTGGFGTVGPHAMSDSVFTKRLRLQLCCLWSTTQRKRACQTSCMKVFCFLAPTALEGGEGSLQSSD